MALLTVYHGGYQAVDKPKINNCFLYMPEQVFTLGRNNEIILTFVLNCPLCQGHFELV